MVVAKVPSIYWKIYQIVIQIPVGTVATYGQVAELVGIGPRQVGQALGALPPGIRCPCHRVINSRGFVSIRNENHKSNLRQVKLLKEEGVVFQNDRVDLQVYQWHPKV